MTPETAQQTTTEEFDRAKTNAKEAIDMMWNAADGMTIEGLHQHFTDVRDQVDWCISQLGH